MNNDGNTREEGRDSNSEEGRRMCEFCLKHGEGEKWYLRAKNYSDDLLSDVRRRKFVENFLSGPEVLAGAAKNLSRLAKAPRFIRGMVSRIVTRRMKKVHFGQVVPIEEVEKIFGFTNSIVRIACACRSVTLRKEKRYCYGISLAPDGGKLGEILRGAGKGFLGGPDGAGFETLSRDEAITAFQAHEKEGLCHSVWTFHAPFIGGICNCDRSDCLAMRSTVTHAVPVMFRGEYVADIASEDCSGCRECMRVCQFGAVTYSASSKKAVIDQRWCYGCGVCRAACKKGAIRLEDRNKAPLAANVWL
jgi:ferredoxin